MTEMGEGATGGTPSEPPAPPERTTETGNIEVEVKAVSICWDTTNDGNPGPCADADVTVRVQSVTRQGRTGADGKVRFDELPTGLASATASKTSYRSGGSPGVTTIEAGATATLSITIELTPSAGAFTVCSRQHSVEPPPDATRVPNPGLPMIFWHGALMIWIREVAWLLFLLLLVIWTIIPIVDMADNMKIDWPTGCFSISVVFLGVVAYLTHIIFGQEAGITMMVLAGLAWIAMIVFTVLAAMGIMTALPINAVWFPVLCGMWAGFFIYLIPRFNSWKIVQDQYYLVLYPIPSLVIAVVMFFLLSYFCLKTLWADTGLMVLYAIGVVIFGWAFGLVGSLVGHVIRNDASLTNAFARSGEPKKLPYAGFAFCVQGNRGWFSHFDGEELCYDFAVPQGSDVIAIEAGHVVRWREDNLRSEYDTLPRDASNNIIEPRLNGPNYIYVQHRDGTVARYFHLQQNGVTSIDTNGALASGKRGTGPEFTCDVHVHAGQVIGKAGSTGQSRFPHIHLGLYDHNHGAHNMLGLEFGDATTLRHGGRCYTFRPYTSDNINKGPPKLRT